jgi:hypothetical protein
MNPLDNVERRDNEPRYSREDRADFEARYEADQQRTALLNAACHAIRSMPLESVDSEFIVQILDTLADKAAAAKMDKVCDALDAANAEIAY